MPNITILPRDNRASNVADAISELTTTLQKKHQFQDALDQREESERGANLRTIASSLPDYNARASFYKANDPDNEYNFPTMAESPKDQLDRLKYGEMTRIMTKGMHDPKSLTPEEGYVFYTLQNAKFGAAGANAMTNSVAHPDNPNAFGASSDVSSGLAESVGHKNSREDINTRAEATREQNDPLIDARVNAANASAGASGELTTNRRQSRDPNSPLNQSKRLNQPSRMVTHPADVEARKLIDIAHKLQAEAARATDPQKKQALGDTAGRFLAQANQIRRAAGLMDGKSIGQHFIVKGDGSVSQSDGPPQDEGLSLSDDEGGPDRSDPNEDGEENG